MYLFEWENDGPISYILSLEHIQSKFHVNALHKHSHTFYFHLYVDWMIESKVEYYLSFIIRYIILSIQDANESHIHLNKMIIE